MEPTLSKDNVKVIVEERVQKEQERSEKAYAIKLVERIVFGIVGTAAMTVLGALLYLVIKQP